MNRYKRDARQIDPEIADVPRLLPGDAAHQRNGRGNAHGRRKEEVQPRGDSLREMREHLLGLIALPVGVGGEGDGLDEGDDSRHLPAAVDDAVLIHRGARLGMFACKGRMSWMRYRP